MCLTSDIQAHLLRPDNDLSNGWSFLFLEYMVYINMNHDSSITDKAV